MSSPQSTMVEYLDADNDLFCNKNGTIRLSKVQKFFKLDSVFEGSEIVDDVLQIKFSKFTQRQPLTQQDLDLLVECYIKYRDTPEYMGLKYNYEVKQYFTTEDITKDHFKTFDDYPGRDHNQPVKRGRNLAFIPLSDPVVVDDYDLHFKKSRKRGNDVYVKWVNQKFIPLIQAEDQPQFDPAYVGCRKRKSTTRLLYITGSMNKHLANQLGYDRGWLQFGTLFNNYMTNLRKKYGRIEFIRCWQSHDSGYVHFHCLLYFLDQMFTVVRWNDKDGSVSFRLPARSKHREYIKNAFKGGYIDICCCHSTRNALKDILKYITRDIDGSGTKSDLTNAMVWYFRRQAWGLSKNFTKCFGVTDDLKPDETEQSEVYDEINHNRHNYEKNPDRVLCSIEVLPLIRGSVLSHLLKIGEDPPSSFEVFDDVFDKILSCLRVDVDYFWVRKPVRSSKMDVDVPVYRWVLERGGF